MLHKTSKHLAPDKDDVGTGKSNVNSLLFKWARNFVVANVCAMWPVLWLGLSWMPHQVKVEAQRGVKVSIVAEGESKLGERYAETAEGCVWRFFLPRSLELENIRFRIGKLDNPMGIKTVWMQKWLFKFGRDGKELEVYPDGNNEFCFRGPGKTRIAFASANVVWGVSLLELLVSAISCIFAKRKRIEGNTSLAGVFGVVFAAALLMELVLPVQSYLANQSAFPYPLDQACGALFFRFVVAFALGGLALWCLVRCFGQWVLSMVMAFAVCAYLESGVLSIGLPTLKGGWWFFENGKRALWDWMAWGGVFCAFFLSRGFFKKHWGMVVVCFLMLVGASLLDTRREQKADPGKLIVDDFSSIPVVLQSVEYSSQTNVLVFVIDSLEREQAHAVMDIPEVGPKLREQFRGFTEYTNNFGAGDCTLMGVANLLTGDYPEKVEGIEDYYDSIFTEKSVLKEYLDENFAIYWATSSASHGYTNRRRRTDNQENNRDRRVLSSPAVLGQPWSLLDFTLFRWMPFGVKGRFLRLASLGLSGQVNCEREWIAYPMLSQASVSDDSRGCFLFIHTAGVHIPVEYDRWGNHLALGNNSYEGCVEMGAFLLEKLGELFDVFRENGIYDNALIVVLADHGRHEDGGRNSEKLPNNALPFLWVKPIGNTQPFETSGVPTSHAKIAELLRASCRQKLSQEEIQACLASQSLRLYRTVDLLSRQKEDWWVDSQGNVVVNKGLLGCAEESDFIPLESGKTYSLKISELAEEHIAVRFVSLGCRVWPSWASGVTNMTCSFKVPDNSKQYDVALTLLCRSLGAAANDPNAHIWFRDEEGRSKWTKTEEGVRVHMRLQELIPNEAGWISIHGKRDDGFRSTVYFENIT
ncbi:MAG: sulfatase-like hydrolase/transferase, partial [Kiritimatiellae bacterium]|nr:sulfatase-like hydrolase/transferase [Kiritimatiellia bacterium]